MAETEGEHCCADQPSEGMYRERAIQASIDRGHTAMSYTGYVKGNVVILKEPLAVPDGAEVEIFIPPAKNGRRQRRGKSSVAQATFGIIPSDPAVVQAVLEEDLYET
jgi:hypothetical protein